MREGAWPALKGVADWTCSRGVWTTNGFEIQKVCGVDEGIPNINNVSYMNLVGKIALEAALACARKLGYTVGTLPIAGTREPAGGRRPLMSRMSAMT